MAKSQVIIRHRQFPTIVEIEVVQPRHAARPVSLERLLDCHRLRCLVHYCIDNGRRAMFYARVIRRDGAPIETTQIGYLLEDLRSATAGDSVAVRARAA